MQRQLTPFEAQAHNQQYKKRDTKEAYLGEWEQDSILTGFICTALGLLAVIGLATVITLMIQV